MNRLLALLIVAMVLMAPVRAQAQGEPSELPLCVAQSNSTHQEIVTIIADDGQEVREALVYDDNANTVTLAEANVMTPEELAGELDSEPIETLIVSTAELNNFEDSDGVWNGVTPLPWDGQVSGPMKPYLAVPSEEVSLPPPTRTSMADVEPLKELEEPEPSYRSPWTMGDEYTGYPSSGLTDMSSFAGIPRPSQVAIRDRVRDWIERKIGIVGLVVGICIVVPLVLFGSLIWLRRQGEAIERKRALRAWMGIAPTQWELWTDEVIRCVQRWEVWGQEALRRLQDLMVSLGFSSEEWETWSAERRGLAPPGTRRRDKSARSSKGS